MQITVAQMNKTEDYKPVLKHTKVHLLVFLPKSSIIFFALLLCSGGGKTRLTTI